MASLSLRTRASLPPMLRSARGSPRMGLLLRRPALVARRPASSSSSSSTSTTTTATTSAAPPLAAAVVLPAESSPLARLRVAFFVVSVGATLFAVYLYTTDTRASIHRWVVPPLLRTIYPDAEDAHHAGTEALKVLYRLGLHPRDRTDSRTSGATSSNNDLALAVFEAEHALANPVGISAGLDKNADVPDALFALGAAVVEVGGCTPRPQAGNPRPRVFRVPSVEGLINRYGLNSIGADAMASRLRARVRAYAKANGLREADILSGAAGIPVGALQPGKLLLVQVAKQKDTDERDVAAVAADYAYCVRRLAPYADVLVVNVSSPNTPGLRDLQAAEPLTRILQAVVDEAGQSAADARAGTPPSAAVEAGLQTLRARPPRVMVKVSPDEDSDAQLDGICAAVFASGVDGIIVGNTTKRREGLVPGKLALPSNERRALAEQGGFSGPALFDRTLALVARYRKRLDEHALRGGGGGGGGGDDDDDHDHREKDTAADAKEDSPAADATPRSKALAQAPEPPKTLFASGGVTTGEQALQLLNAGASVAMLYTGLVYGGAGTVTRIKEEMRERVGAGAQAKPAEAQPVQTQPAETQPAAEPEPAQATSAA